MSFSASAQYWVVMFSETNHGLFMGLATIMAGNILDTFVVAAEQITSL